MEERSLNPMANNLEFLKKRRERLRSAYPKDKKVNDEGMVF